ncbi:hypothetical protein LCGC14_1471220 [marine sediment metagenome]|uniref:Uncharacterized protein n=1 Tax=marine sediment metagenome TaxID=412755 RepID=A0A0F9ME35_9ZZZZ
MSFRNVSRRQGYDVLRTRSKRPTDEKKWRDIYPPQVSNIRKVKVSRAFTVLQQFAVANWVPAVVGIISGLAAVVGGFYIGQKYSTANIIKKFAKKSTHLLPKKLQSYL